MARKSNLAASIDSALAAAAQRVLAEAVSALPGTTSIGSLMDELKSRSYDGQFRAMSIDEFVSARSGAAPAPRAARRPGRPAAAAAPAAPAAAAAGKRGRKPKVNTRTAAGRAAMDERILELLADQGSAKAEDVRRVVGGNPNQIRASMRRLESEGKVKISGEKRGTTYTLKKK